MSESLDILFRLHAFARAANPFLFRLRMNFYLCQSVPLTVALLVFT